MSTTAQNSNIELKEYDFHDNSLEKDYNNLVEITSVICNTPIAFISVIKSDKQVFIASQGMSIKELPIGQAFCNYTLKNNEVFEVENTKEHSEFKNNSFLIKELKLIFFAGITLRSEEGVPLGTLCVGDFKPRKLTDIQKKSLANISTQVRRLFTISRKNHKLIELEEKTAKFSKEMEEFAYVASHDLREPLRMVMSFLGLLEMKYKDIFDEKATKYIEFAVDGAKRMDQMITDLLKYSRATSTEMDIEVININLLLDEIKKDLSYLIEETNAQLILEDFPEVKSNKVALKQIFVNLISNAIKFTKADVEPVIEISYTIEDKFMKVFIKDNGIGIEESDKPSIFNLFSRRHSQDDYKGSGIGLAICKKNVEKLGGEISYESNEDKGTTFIFTFIVENV